VRLWNLNATSPLFDARPDNNIQRTPLRAAFDAGRQAALVLIFSTEVEPQ
jgi:hypothetical protein